MDEVRRLSPRRRALLVATALAVVVALGAAVAVAAGLWRRAEPRLERAAEVPVLLVPGYNGTPGSLGVLAARLRSAGREVVVVALPDRGTGDLRASAGALADAVDRTGAARVDLVGFSAGGVVVRLWLDDPARAPRARRVVLLGTPNHGTDLAGAAAALDPGLCAGACAQLVPGSSLLAELNQGDETPPGPEVFSIWTALDQTVTPPATATLDGAANIRVQDVCASARLGHGGLVADPLAVGLVVEALAGTLPDPPGAGDCAALRAAGRSGAPTR
jgi:triacylglycerol esterase/lipase EstA (alpha/beta hydrolase family)